MIDLSRNAALADILHELEGDHSVEGYRGGMLAFMRLCEVASGEAAILALWRFVSTHPVGTPEDCTGFARFLYEHVWPKLTLTDKNRMANVARAIAGEYATALKARNQA
jgi:hypothetical protein